MMPPSDEVGGALSEVERLYSQGLERHGASPRSVGWKDTSSQHLRFSKLAQVLPAGPVQPISVNDLGCGYGSLLSFLDAIDGVQLTRYYGYDISEPMLNRARQLTDERALLVRGSEASHVADYSFASGPFNVKGSSTDATWRAHVQQCVLQLAQASRRGFAFNLLTTFVDFKQENLFYADPCEFFDFCKREISPYVTLLHDYPLYEWTMLVHHRSTISEV